jgi:cation transport regulator
MELKSPAKGWKNKAQKGKVKTMPYQNLQDLPDSVKDSLPKHAQEIYKEAYNSAWDQYEDPQDRRDDKDREETAHSVAWAAVKKKYKKVSEGEWQKKAA